MSLVLFALSFGALALAVYEPALTGPFISDDHVLVRLNPFVQSPDARGLVAIFDPTGTPRHYTLGNYAPVLHLAHALEWQLWEGDTRGYHVVNVGLHALNAALLVLLLSDSGVPRRAALAGGALFLLHPANVESVAWIAQLRGLLALAFSLGALLLVRRRPLASVPLFALGLLAKAAAAFALPMAAVLWWARRGAGAARPREGRALALWVAVLAIYAPLQVLVFSTTAESPVERFPDLATHVRSMAAFGFRYLVMAATSWGTSAYHEPPPATSNLDPWWLGGVVAAVLLGWRIVSTLRRRRVEAAWWIGAAASFVPVSQALPFYFLMADRYLYFVLPGLIGGTMLCAGELGAALRARVRIPAAGERAVGIAATALGAALLVGFGLRSHERAALWQDPFRLYVDAASQYPQSSVAHYAAGILATERGDFDLAFDHLEQSARQGLHLVSSFLEEPRLAPLRSDPRFPAFERKVLESKVASLHSRGRRNATLEASLHYARGELDRAIAVLEAELERVGPRRDLLDPLLRLRAERAERARGGPDAPDARDQPGK